MPTSSVHPIHLLTQTPATNKKQSLNLHRTLQKTKPRDFDIYIDHHSSSPELDPRRAIKHVASTKKKQDQKPLEDKTNTVRKKLSRVRIDDQLSPTNHKSVKPESTTKSIFKSNSQLLLTPHPTKNLKIKKSPSFNQLSASKNDPLKRLLYRTPVTSKRAPRPPVAFDTNDDDDNGEVSFVTSKHSINHLDFDLTQGDIPDVEYGPPSAIIEPIESLIDDKESSMEDFFKNLKEDASNYLISEHSGWTYDASKDKMATEIEDILSSDGRKDRWTCEPRCEMTNYAVDDLLDEFLIPSGPTHQPTKVGPKKAPVLPSSSRSSHLTAARTSSHPSGTSRPATLRSKVHLPAPVTRQTSRNLANKPPHSQTPPSVIPPNLSQYHQLVQSLVLSHHQYLDSLPHLSSPPLPPLLDLDSFQLDLVA